MSETEMAVAILSQGQQQLLGQFVSHPEMQAKVFQIVRQRKKLKPAEAIDHGKIASYNQSYGEMDTVGLLLLLIIDWNNSFHIENRLSDKDCAECAHMLYRECSFLSMAEVAVLLERAKYGINVKIYGSGATQRIGKDTFWSIIEAHLDQRKELVLGKKETLKDKYEFRDGKWILNLPEQSRGVPAPPEILEAIKSIGTDNTRKSIPVQVDERSRDEKNKNVLLYQLRDHFPKEVGYVFMLAETKLQRFKKHYTVGEILANRHIKPLIPQLGARLEAMRSKNLL